MLDAETKRRIGVLGAAELRAVAAYAARGGGYRFHGLTPTAKCGRRIRGLLEPRAGARAIVLIYPRPAAVL